MDRKNSLKVLKDISAVKYYIEKDSADISEETRNIRDRLLKNFDVIEKAISPRDAILINQINSDKTNKEYVEYAELLKKTKELKYQNIGSQVGLMEKLEGEIGDYKISHKRKDDKNTNHATIREDIKQIGIRLDPNHLGLENLVLPLKELKEVLGNDLYERYISYIEILRSKAFQLANLHNLEELESMDIFPNRDPESRLTNRFRLDNHIRLTVESLASLDNLRNKGELTFILNDLDIKEDQIAISKICEILQIDSQKFMKTLKENSKVKIGIFNTKEYGVGIRIGDYENRIGEKVFFSLNPQINIKMIEERLHLLWKVKDMLKEEKQKEKRKQRKLESSV